MRPVAVALGLGLVALLLGLVLSLSHGDRGSVGTNRVIVGRFATVLDRDHPRACTRTAVPSGAATIRLVVDAGNRPRPPLAARVGDVRGQVHGGRSGQQEVEIPFADRVPTGEQRVCVGTIGRGRVPIGGSATTGVIARYEPGGDLAPAFRVDWGSGHAVTGWDRIGVVARHLGWGRSAALRSGTGVLVVAGLLVLAALGLAVRLVLRASE